MVKIKGIAWAGTKLDKEKYEQTSKFFKDMLGFTPQRALDGLTIFELPNGDYFEVIGPNQAVELNGLVTGPKVDFLVDDVREAREELEKMGLKFEGPIYEAADQNWTHFWAPDGYLYGLTDMHAHPAQKYCAKTWMRRRSTTLRTSQDAECTFPYLLSGISNPIQ
jgi:hypothetical protein